jgi:soluble lytic murein transglycosylase-like protein
MTMIARSEIARAATAFGLDPDLLHAQVLVESSGDADAFRYEPAFFRRYIKGNTAAKAATFGPLAACSFGPLQIMLETACEIGFVGQPWELFTPAIGLEWGARHLASLLRWAGGDYHRALAAFNGGKGGNVLRPLRNQPYVDRVLAQWEKLKEPAGVRNPDSP